ncbi:MAG: sulfatase [Bryobacteraceae bacterium]
MATRREFLAATVTAPLTGAVKRPNIVFLMADQHRGQTVGCLGDEQAITPNLDRLAGEGMILDRTFANTPVCCPARAILLTGQYCHRNGMVANDLRLRESSLSFAEELRKAGYRTGFVGKWHLNGGPRLPGFVPPGDRRHGFEYWAANECSHTHFKNTIFRDTPDPIILDKFETDGYADFAVEFLKGVKTDQRPFYLTVQWGPPHDPYKAPPEYSRMYNASKLKLRPNWREGPGVPGRKEIAEYYAMVTAVDDAAGRIVRTLDELGLRDDTIVLYSSDHGDMLGSHGERLKRKPWEESIKVPGILRWPKRVKQGSRSRQFFTHVDFAPTLLGMAGLPVPKAMQGEDLSDAILKGKRGPDSAFFQIFGPYRGDGTTTGWRGVRTERHMYARFKNQPWVLYDIEKDPYEMTNLAGERSAAAVQGEMERRLVSWMEKAGDNWNYDWSHFVEDGGALYKHRAFYTINEYLEWIRQHPELSGR